MQGFRFLREKPYFLQFLHTFFLSLSKFSHLKDAVFA